jgi:membrane protease YdiL (CAAX protease family)
MDIISGIIIAVTLIIVANILEKQQNPTAINIFERVLMFLSVPFLLQGGIFALASEATLANLPNDMGALLTNPRGAGLILMATGVWGVILSFRAVRLMLMRWLPINPKSPVHTLALILSGYFMGLTLVTLAEGGLESLAESTVSVPITTVVLQQTGFAILAFLGVGLFLRRDREALQKRLGLAWPTRHQLLMGLRWVPILVGLQWLIGVIWALSNPEQLQLVDDISTNFLREVDTVWEWFALALSAGIGEELLFRGALQPALGLGFTAVLFAISHIQYGFTPATLAIFVIAIVLGRIRQQSNTVVAIAVHFGYDFMLGLFALLATQAEQFLR